MAAYMVFCTNASFLVEENYGKSTMTLGSTNTSLDERVVLTCAD